MILSRVQDDLFHVLTARLRRSNGKPVRLFGNGPHVLAYLRANPDTDFLLEAVQTGRPLHGTGKAKYLPGGGDVICGGVRFDSVANVVTCTSTSLRVRPQRIHERAGTLMKEREGRRKVGRQKRRMRAKIRYRK